MHADRYEAERLRELLSEESFQRAISATEAIARKTEDRTMYDQREKAQRDYQWAIDSARREGLEKGREEGREEGLERGVLVGRIQVFEQLLGQEPTATEHLVNRLTEELTAVITDLQQRLCSRGE